MIKFKRTFKKYLDGHGRTIIVITSEIRLFWRIAICSDRSYIEIRKNSWTGYGEWLLLENMEKAGYMLSERLTLMASALDTEQAAFIPSGGEPYVK